MSGFLLWVLFVGVVVWLNHRLDRLEAELRRHPLAHK